MRDTLPKSFFMGLGGWGGAVHGKERAREEGERMAKGNINYVSREWDWRTNMKKRERGVSTEREKGGERGKGRENGEERERGDKS